MLKPNANDGEIEGSRNQAELEIVLRNRLPKVSPNPFEVVKHMNLIWTTDFVRDARGMDRIQRL